MSAVDVDVYAVAGLSDHIVPWDNAYRSVQLFGGARRFVLSRSGHIQSLVNPPAREGAESRASYRAADDFSVERRRLRPGRRSSRGAGGPTGTRGWPPAPVPCTGRRGPSATGASAPRPRRPEAMSSQAESPGAGEDGRWWGRPLAETRWQLELARLLVDPVLWGHGVARGDGRPVLLLPGFLAGDQTLLVLAAWLRRIGYRPYTCGFVAKRAVRGPRRRTSRAARGAAVPAPRAARRPDRPQPWRTMLARWAAGVRTWSPTPCRWAPGCGRCWR